MKKEAEATEAAAAGEKDKDTATKKSAETPTDRLIKDGQLQSAATVGFRLL